MKRPLLRRLVDKLKGRTKAPPPAQAEKKAPRQREKKNTGSSFEPLENRIAPAILINATTVTYKDLDGDLVTVKFSKPVFTGSANSALLTAQTMFTFKDAAGGTTHITDNNDTGEQLQLLAINSIAGPGTPNPLSGASLSITAAMQDGAGDDRTEVGYIRASSSPLFGVSLGHVTVDGDLGRMDAGNSNNAVAVKSLTVESFGEAGLSTQDASGSLHSTFTGAIGKLVVEGDIVDAEIEVVKGLATNSVGNIGSISIGGSLRTSAGNSATGAGSITCEGKIGFVTIGSILGGDGDESGRIKADGTIGRITISGDIRGGDGGHSGEITALKTISKVQLTGNLWAGTGDNSGRISSDASIGAVAMRNLHGDFTAANTAPGEGAATINAGGKIGSLTLQDSLLGGAEDNTGSVTAGGRLGSLTVGGSIIGGAGARSGHVDAVGIGDVTVGQVVTGGGGDFSGTVASQDSIGKITIRNDLAAAAAITAGVGSSSGAITAEGGIGRISVTGGLDARPGSAGERSGSIIAGGFVASAKINGALFGGDGALSGSIATGGAMGPVRIFGSVTGGSGVASGSIIASGRLASLSMNGTLSGGEGAESGSIIAGSDPSVVGDIGNLSILGAIIGADGVNSGSIRAGGRIANLSIGFETPVPSPIILGGSGAGSATIFSSTGITKATIHGHVVGGGGQNSAAIFAEGTIAKLSISGELRGGAGTDSASIRALDRLSATGIVQGALGTIELGGVVGGIGTGSAMIYADGSLARLTAASVTGGSGAGSAAILIGQGQSALDDNFADIGGAKMIAIIGALTAGVGSGSATIETGGSLTTLEVGGGVSGSAIRVGRDLGSAHIAGPVSGVFFSALGKSAPRAGADLAIGKFTVDSDVSDSRFLAGYDRFGGAANGNAQVDAFTVNGNWTASSLVAGVKDVNGDGFGNADDAVIVGGITSKIASIIITGNLTGSVATGDHFGFVAQVIASAKVGGAMLGLTDAKDTIPLAGNPPTDDTTLLEIP